MNTLDLAKPKRMMEERVKTITRLFVQETFCDVTELVVCKITYFRRMEQMPSFKGENTYFSEKSKLWRLCLSMSVQCGTRTKIMLPGLFRTEHATPASAKELCWRCIPTHRIRQSDGPLGKLQGKALCAFRSCMVDWFS